MAENKKRTKLKQSEVLRYSKNCKSQGTVRRHYLKWRQQQNPPLPVHCDNPNCKFYIEPLIWNGEILPLILDHINGNNSDDRPKNLRLLCPNCNSQLKTSGGANKGRVEKSDGGFAIIENGKRNYVMPIETCTLKLTSGKVEFKLNKGSC
jgi:hypothetical protein